jgi:hypothetical protein
VTGSIFYVVEIELPMADLAQFVPWYASVHAPHLFQAGFRNCTSYLAVSGGMSVVDIYQSEDWSMFEAPQFARYRPIAAEDPWRPKALRGITNVRTVYHHDALPGVTTRDADLPLDADWVSIWRFTGDAALQARVAAWLAATGAVALSAQGVRNVRLLHKGKDAPTGGSRPQPLALVAEWSERPPAAAHDSTLLAGWPGPAITAAECFTGMRLYPWAAGAALRAEVDALVAALRTS